MPLSASVVVCVCVYFVVSCVRVCVSMSVLEYVCVCFVVSVCVFLRVFVVLI